MILSKFKPLKVAIFGLLLTLICFTWDVQAALAHYPHDDIVAVETSPNYQQDQTLWINVRGNLLKSEDGGKSWQRIIKGLDHQYELSALKIAADSPKTLFLATFGDGIYKSQDGGDSWTQVNEGLTNLNIDLLAIGTLRDSVIAPNSTEVVLAAGTKTGLFLTTNGGASWSQVMGGHKISATGFFADKLIVGDNQGNLFLSDNRGQSWQNLATLKNSGGIRAIAISPDHKTMWVGTATGGIFKTVNGGVSFTPVNKGMSDQAILSLAISPNYHKDSTILATTWDEGVFASHDGGQTWHQQSKGLTTDKQADYPNFQRPHFSDLSIVSTFSKDQTMFLAGFDGLFKSTDGGLVWREVNTLTSNIIVGLGLSPNYQNDSTLAITTYLGGAYISHDQGTTWTTINKGLEKDDFLQRTAKKILQDGYVARLFGIVFSPNYQQDKTIFSPAWTDFLKSTNQGQQWQKIPLTTKPGLVKRPTKYAIAISPNFARDKTIYLGSMQGTGQDFILKSTDGGSSFSMLGKVNGQPIVYLAISPDFATDKTLYAGVKDGVYKTVDGGQTWQLTSQDLPSLPEESKLAISPNYKVDQTVFAGTTAGLFVTRDGGQSWSKLARSTENDYIEAVAISPNYQSERTVMISVRGKGLFKSMDGGTTFNRVGDNLLNSNQMLTNMYGFWPPTAAIQFSPAYTRDRTIYGVSQTNLLKSTDGGNTWVKVFTPTPPGTNLKQLITYYYLRFTIAPIAKFLAATLAALAIYLILERSRLAKKLPWKPRQIKISSTFAVFIVVFILFST
jgi:photosystem II stability/assembly factor-like uncharacterized protein